LGEQAACQQLSETWRQFESHPLPGNQPQGRTRAVVQVSTNVTEHK